MKQVRYQTIKQVGHLVIYTNLMSLVVACVAGGICFGDLSSHKKIGLRSKHFRFVSEQTKTSDLAAREMEQAPFFARSLTLVPRSFLRNCTEMLAT